MVAPRSSSYNKKDTESKSSGPGGGSLNAPTRTAPSTGRMSSNTAPSGSKFGPREKSTPVSTAPSSMARESTADSLSRSVPKKITDRVGETSQKPRSGPSIGPTEAASSQPARQKTSLNAMSGPPTRPYSGIPERIGQERLALTGNPPSSYKTPEMQGPQRPPRASVSQTLSNYQAERSAREMKNPTQRAYDQYNPSNPGSGAPLRPGVKTTGDKTRSLTGQKAPIPKLKPNRVSAAPIPKAKPAKPVTATPTTQKSTKVSGKSKTRVAFEKEFAAARARKEKVFTFKGKKYSTRVK